ncbi:MAG: hypothetical protein ABI562_00935 [Chloroflexota bacterium]
MLDMSATPTPAFGQLTYPVLASLALAGAALGWLVTDRVAVHGQGRWAVIGAGAAVALTIVRVASGQGGPPDIVALGGVAGSLVRGVRQRSSDPTPGALERPGDGLRDFDDGAMARCGGHEDSHVGPPCVCR